MKIFFAGVQLTDWEDFPAEQVNVVGATMIDAVDIVRSTGKRFFSRGNDNVTLQFSARAIFGTNREAQVYAVAGFFDLPADGLCQVICGGPGDDDSVQCWMPEAVLIATPQRGFDGLKALVQFTIKGGGFTASAPPDLYLGTEAMILRGKQAIGNGADSVNIAFAPAFPGGTTPIIVIATVTKPSGTGSNIFPTIRDDTITVAGFTAELSGPTPDANHKLDWIAIGP